MHMLPDVGRYIAYLTQPKSVSFLGPFPYLARAQRRALLDVVASAPRPADHGPVMVHKS
ncbi:hypothetical protein C8Q78DRAFT_1008027 [Trametes maxima]|nr:hypothetical protein C8Q78DRAFT_1008027 [Trametes maxima]